MTTSANHPMAWADQGACRGVDPTVFYPLNDIGQPYPAKKPLPPATVAAARRHCDTCPVRPDCHDWALHHETEGIWAGTDPHGRRRMRVALGIEVEQAHPDEATGLEPSVAELTATIASAKTIASVLGLSSRTVGRIRTGATKARRPTTPKAATA